MATKWPRDNQADRNAFYGDPAKNEIEPQLVDVVPPFTMYYDGKPISRIRFHKKAAPALKAALDEIWLAFNKDQAAIDKAGVSEFNGAYNKRLVRGSTSKWSNHAYGAAIDINASHNPLGATTGAMPQAVIDAFTRQGAMWGGWYSGRKDLMHFEFVDNGGRKPTNPAPTGTSAAVNIVPVPETLQKDPIIEDIQALLVELGYYEVGDADGIIGGKTKAGIAAFLNDNHLESYTNYQTLLDYMKRRKAAGFMRPIAPARAYATASDIAPKVEAVKTNAVTRTLSKIVAVPSAVGAAVSGVVSNVPDAYNIAKPYVDIVKEFMGSIPGWVYLLVIAAVGFAIWRAANKTEEVTVADYQKGRIN